jgi:hypothetical protein
MEGLLILCWQIKNNHEKVCQRNCANYEKALHTCPAPSATTILIIFSACGSVFPHRDRAWLPRARE